MATNNVHLYDEKTKKPSCPSPGKLPKGQAQYAMTQVPSEVTCETCVDLLPVVPVEVDAAPLPGDPARRGERAAVKRPAKKKPVGQRP